MYQMFFDFAERTAESMKKNKNERRKCRSFVV